MNNISVRTASFAVWCVLLISMRPSVAEAALVGTWVGGFGEGENYVFLQLHFESKDGKVSGSYDAPLLFQQGRSLREVEIESSQVRFEISKGPTRRVFGGEMKDGTLAGFVKEGMEEKPFLFTRLAPITVSNYTGIYRIEPGHYLAIRSGSETGLAAPQFIDFNSGCIGMLFPTTDTNFFTGPALLIPHSVDATVNVTLHRNGRATGLDWSGSREFEAMHFIQQRYRCALTGEGWEALEEEVHRLRHKRWFEYTGGHVGKEHPFWQFWNLIRSYDPVPVMERVTCPVLAIFGAKDTFLPAEKSARIGQAALDKAGNDDATIRIFPDGDHSLIESETGGLLETARARRFVPGYFDLLQDWTLKQVEIQP